MVQCVRVWDGLSSTLAVGPHVVWLVAMDLENLFTKVYFITQNISRSFSVVPPVVQIVYVTPFLESLPTPMGKQLTKRKTVGLVLSPTFNNPPQA